ncbi:MAG: flagellar biosynthesis protein FlgE [Deltaproteobacteria bacterium HGW-Deltaproteobacteria-21]|nr:MAG: flagellar biosynthesis protein FlgE [Deltaproteobacteria bacterium HGW-Deltaproteobacteria-21]
MALSSALFSGISGLSTLGNAMQIIGDNIANVNTVGFKNSTFTFQDLLSQSTATMSGTSQVGRGTALGDIYSSFEQGSFESTGNTTDLAIGGDGFFVMRESASENLFYTRAGNFRFDKDGYLINPEGYVVQGWELDENGQDIGSIEDVLLSSFTSPPRETDKVKVIVNLDSDGDDNSVGVNALSGAWNGAIIPPIGETAYEYQTTMKVYDSLGSTHDVTIYFDKANSTSAYEFIVTCNPDEDNRTITSASQTGLLGRGVITFSSGSGVITDISMASNNGDGTWTALTTGANLTDGYFTFAPEFIDGNAMSVQLDFGSRFDGSSWVNGSLSTSQFARSSTTTFQSANGYGAGDLQGVNVDVDGIITGTYSNGQLIPLYRVALAKFTNEQGLFKLGGNLFQATRESGDAITNKPGSNGLGSIAPNSLEQSNVDLATEFVKMISTQRGFQANSKIITVVDSMLQELINLKR